LTVNNFNHRAKNPMRLRRPMCGMAMPFRNRFTKSGGCASNSGTAASKRCIFRQGEALPHIKRQSRKRNLDVALLIGMFFVSFDDHLDELVAHHIFLSEIDELNPLKIGQHAFSFD
jgi:hypothetical protein